MADKQLGIVSDSPLHKSTLAKAVAECGLSVAINTSPDRITSEEMADESIEGWIVDLADEDKWADFLDEFLDTATVPLLFGEGEVPAFNSSDFKRWQKRFNKKLESLFDIPVVSALSGIAATPPTATESPAQLESSDVEAPPVITRALDSEVIVEGGSLGGQPTKSRISLPANIKTKAVKGTPAQYIWVLGASLGGPGAVKRFLDVLPEGLPVGFVYAQHIDNNFLPVLTQVLGRHSVYDMKPCSHKRKVGVGEVHIVPVNHQIQCNAQDGIVFLHNRRWQGLYNPAISSVMKELVNAYGPDSGSIIFSGMGEDATEGAIAMADAGAEVWVQKLSTCASASMPESVLGTGRCTFQGTPEELAEKLVQYIAAKHQDAVRIDDNHEISIDDPIYPF